MFSRNRENVVMTKQECTRTIVCVAVALLLSIYCTCSSFLTLTMISGRATMCVFGYCKRDYDKSAAKSDIHESNSHFRICDDRNCSYNGVCITVDANYSQISNNEDISDTSVNGEVPPSWRCRCDHGWKGQFCEQLNLGFARNGSGLSYLLHDGQNRRNGSPSPSPSTITSTWGGSVSYSPETQLYHMMYSEILYSCGIHTWLGNSVVSHAISKGARDNWKFTKVHPPMESVPPFSRIFSHEPVLVRDPRTQEYVVFFTHYHTTAWDGPSCNCTDGTSASGNCEAERGVSRNKTMYSYFSTAKSPFGPWSQNIVSLKSVQGTKRKLIDMNLSPILLSNDSAIAWTRWNIWSTKSNRTWRDPSSWVDLGQGPDFHNNATWEGEDPSLWQDSKGRYHILSHNGKRGVGGNSTYPYGDCGRHFFSETGLPGTWEMAPLPLGGCAYPRINVPFINTGYASSDRGKYGWIEDEESVSYYDFYRRERPHIVFGPDPSDLAETPRMLPLALSTAVIDSPIGPGMDGFQHPQRDASYTLIQPIV